MNGSAVCERRMAPAERLQPAGPWQWAQTWRNLLFLHWRAPADRLQELVPAQLELDAWDGAAWVSAIAFRLKNRLRGLPEMPLCSNFLELNLRTYVRYRGEPGVFFLTMHANSAVAVTAARWLTPLPYAFAPMTSQSPDGQWRWQCGPPARHLLNGRFRLHGQQILARADSLDEWLLERYRAFVADRRGRLFRMSVEHPPWQVSEVTCDIAAVQTEPSIGITLERSPDQSHYSPGLDALVWPFERLS